jgi:hypothetical protein
MVAALCVGIACFSDCNAEPLAGVGDLSEEACIVGSNYRRLAEKTPAVKKKFVIKEAKDTHKAHIVDENTSGYGKIVGDDENTLVTEKLSWLDETGRKIKAAYLGNGEWAVGDGTKGVRVRGVTEPQLGKLQKQLSSAFFQYESTSRL